MARRNGFSFTAGPTVRISFPPAASQERTCLVAISFAILTPTHRCRLSDLRGGMSVGCSPKPDRLLLKQHSSDEIRSRDNPERRLDPRVADATSRRDLLRKGSVSGSPTPDNCSTCGEPTAPAARITSHAASRRTVGAPGPPLRENSTPIARFPSNRTRCTNALVTTCKLGRFDAGRK